MEEVNEQHGDSDCTAKIAVLQFSNDVKVEAWPTSSAQEIHDIVDKLERINGGTCIAQPMSESRKMLSCGDPDAIRTVTLMSDARMDTIQAQDAKFEARSLQSVSAKMIALGIGRGADTSEMLHLLDASASDTNDTALSRFLPLRTSHGHHPLD